MKITAVFGYVGRRGMGKNVTRGQAVQAVLQLLFPRFVNGQ